MKSGRSRPQSRPLAWMALLALAGAAGVVGSVPADDPSWKAVAASGRVEASTDVETASWRSVARGDELAESSAVRTGRRGRATLTRGADILILDPRSEVVLPASSRSSTVEQNSGSVLYEIDGRVNPDFKVVTPYLVAGVKGTEFVVTVDDRHASVSVIHGVVEVFDPLGDEKLAVRAGEAVLRESGQPTFELVRPDSVDTVHPPGGGRDVASKKEDSGDTKSVEPGPHHRSNLASRGPVWFDSWPQVDAHGQGARRGHGPPVGEDGEHPGRHLGNSGSEPIDVDERDALDTTLGTELDDDDPDDQGDDPDGDDPPVSLPPVSPPEDDPVGRPPIGDPDDTQSINRNP